MIDLDKLLEAAEKATPGPWLKHKHRDTNHDVIASANHGLISGIIYRDEDHQFTALANPQTVKSIVLALKEAMSSLDIMLQAFDSSHPGACHQDCFDTSDGHGYEMQDIGIRKGREAFTKINKLLGAEE